MCLQPAAWPEPDPQIAAAIEAKYQGKRPLDRQRTSHLARLELSIAA